MRLIFSQVIRWSLNSKERKQKVAKLPQPYPFKHFTNKLIAVGMYYIKNADYCLFDKSQKQQSILDINRLEITDSDDTITFILYWSCMNFVPF